MGFSSLQYDTFREQVVREGKAYTFTDEEDLLIYRTATGETVPFWSSRSRVETVQKRFPKYRQWQIAEIEFRDFWRHLDQLEREGIQVGVNWSGKQLEGYSVPVADLREALRYWIGRLG